MAAVDAAASSLTFYSWPGFLGRTAPGQRMLTVAGREFKWVTDFEGLLPRCATLGSKASGFAPPILEVVGAKKAGADGADAAADAAAVEVVAQSAAVTMYVGRLTGMEGPFATAPHMAVMAMNTASDAESELNRAIKTADDLAAFVEPSTGRLFKFFTSLEEQVHDTRFFGSEAEEPTYVDYFWSFVVDWAREVFADALADKLGQHDGDGAAYLLRAHPKLLATYRAVRDHPKLAELNKTPVISAESNGIRFHAEDAVVAEVAQRLSTGSSQAGQ